MYIKFDVHVHRPRRSRGNEKDKLPSGVEPRSNDQQTSTQTLSHDHQTKVRPLIPSYNIKLNTSLPGQLRIFNNVCTSFMICMVTMNVSLNKREGARPTSNGNQTQDLWLGIHSLLTKSPLVPLIVPHHWSWVWLLVSPSLSCSSIIYTTRIF